MDTEVEFEPRPEYKSDMIQQSGFVVLNVITHVAG